MSGELIERLERSRRTGEPPLPPSLAPEVRELRLPQWAQLKLASLRIALLQSVGEQLRAHQDKGGENG